MTGLKSIGRYAARLNIIRLTPIPDFGWHPQQDSPPGIPLHPGKNPASPTSSMNIFPGDLVYSDMKAQSQTCMITLHPFRCFLTLPEVIRKDHWLALFPEVHGVIIKRRYYEHSIY
jgi:hypothetical protein